MDLGSGGGLDVILSARRTGPTGTAYGLNTPGLRVHGKAGFRIVGHPAAHRPKAFKEFRYPTSPIITADLKHDADSDELRLASVACDWGMIVAEHQVGVEAAVAILAGIKAEGEALVRQLERFTASGEQAAYDRAMRVARTVARRPRPSSTC